jgi:hypothetical protein
VSRYDRDENPDEIRDSGVQRPTESSRRQETSDAKGRGGGSGTSQDQPPRHEIRPGKVRSFHQGRRTKHPDLDRDRTYSLRDSELKTLTDIGTFRVLKLDDLATHRYGGDPAEARPGAIWTICCVKDSSSVAPPTRIGLPISPSPRPLTAFSKAAGPSTGSLVRRSITAL